MSEGKLRWSLNSFLDKGKWIKYIAAENSTNRVLGTLRVTHALAVLESWDICIEELKLLQGQGVLMGLESLVDMNG